MWTMSAGKKERRSGGVPCTSTVMLQFVCWMFRGCKEQYKQIGLN